MALLLAVMVAAGTWVFIHLNGNIHHSALYLGNASPGTERRNSAGQSPMNVLVIGSDSRQTAADCAIGGDCGPGANADVEILVHLSAGRTSATVMSIPRDTVVDIPQCTDPKTRHVYPPLSQTQITSSLQDGGPGCTVAAVHALTAIPIDHFVMADFAGVVSMSDAIGGVPVCVDNNVYDPYSHLKLAKGVHTLKGLAALELLRTRHGFGDGGDLGREAAQQVFLTALTQKLRRAGTLTDPVAMYGLADAATKALTVDDGLAGITKLASLARQLSDVPTERINFVTMPNVPYPANPNWLSPAPGAKAVFQAIADDRAVTDGATSPVTPQQGTAPSAKAGSAAGGGAGITADAAQASDFTRVGDASGAAQPAVPATTVSERNAAADPGCLAVGTLDTTPFGSPVRAYAVNPQIPDSAP
ncbi:LCP family protein [Streptacidiphilus sp. MAP12-16]|uniref:LCP family protein n=1 Tax=Streptacidiphilus sp. MAP12-16 TaxID=3156300 RepID=UPI0035131F13